MDEQVRKYNTQIRELLDVISAEFSGNPMIDTIHRRFRVALSIRGHHYPSGQYPVR